VLHSLLPGFAEQLPAQRDPLPVSWPAPKRQSFCWCPAVVLLPAAAAGQAALGELLLAEESFGLVSPSVLGGIDNLAMLLLDIVW
jgi:hypothetical protein